MHSTAQRAATTLMLQLVDQVSKSASVWGPGSDHGSRGITVVLGTATHTPAFSDWTALRKALFVCQVFASIFLHRPRTAVEILRKLCVCCDRWKLILLPLQLRYG